jgi:hypothetical protein
VTSLPDLTHQLSLATLRWSEEPEEQIDGLGLIVTDRRTALLHEEYLEKHFEDATGTIDLWLHNGGLDSPSLSYRIPTASGDFFAQFDSVSQDVSDSLRHAFENQRYVYVVCCIFAEEELEPLSDGGMAVLSQMRIDGEIITCPHDGVWPSGRLTILD